MNEKEKLKNLIIELYAMIKDEGIAGDISLGLSHDSVDLIEKLYERDKKEGQQSN